MQSTIAKLSILTAMSAVLLVAGCDNANIPALGKVSGTVSYRGKPIAEGTLIIEVPGTRPAYGKISAGKIVEVTTFKTGDGAPLGNARIAVFAADAAATPPSSGPPGYGGGKSLIPAKYNDPAASGLTAEIKSGENTLALDLQ